jgi:hypothetical protein
VQVDEKRVICAGKGVIRLWKFEENKLVGPIWKASEFFWMGDYFGSLAVTPSKDKIIFSFGSFLAILDLDTGKIDATWEARVASSFLRKFVSPSLVAYGRYNREIYLSKWWEQKYCGKIEASTGIYDWEGVSSGKYIVCGTSRGGISVHDTENILGDPVMTEKKITENGALFIYEIFPNFLIVFDSKSFYFFDLDYMAPVVPSCSNFICKTAITWVFQLPNGNFLIQGGQPYKYLSLLDFSSKMWDKPFKWLFLGFEDKKSKFKKSNLPRDILLHIWKVSHVACFV